MTQSYNLSQLANRLNSSGQLDATVGLVNATPAANGGTGQSSYTTGDILYASGSTALARLPDVATGYVLISGGVGAAPSYGKVGLTTHVSGTLPLANGGLGATTFTSNAVLLGNGTSVFNSVSPGASGQVLTSNGTTWASASIPTPIGVGQTWQDVTSSRTTSITYTNSTGKSISVNIMAYSNGTTYTLKVGGVTASSWISAQPFTCCVIVPDGASYVLSAGTTIISWSELR